MTSRLEALRTYLAAAFVLCTLGGLAVDLAQTAYAVAHTARVIILAAAN